MQIALSPAHAVLLTLTVAVGYAVATIGMKLVSDHVAGPGAAVLAVGLVAVVVGEIVLMRTTPLSVLYVTIIGVETVLVLAYAIWIGEGFSMRQAMGGLMVLAGLAIVSH
ncbi:hypothetical protein ATO8_02080 [Roseivivax marinus]|uniref:5-aminolevulinate synthase n=1 Tax=Roseivivax marinus TaxID=1379903 RepID=W4HPG1_9RHOB|nr:hypothetical protein [Roseivivax marinus]ETW14657.1 hypothetical protein ATO8_02080 [Roseivivax marinus]